MSINLYICTFINKKWYNKQKITPKTTENETKITQKLPEITLNYLKLPKITQL